MLGQFCRLLEGKSVKHINHSWVKPFGCNSERIEGIVINNVSPAL
ncbi:hypothetical protein TCARB_1782 [Thermofilum adornatum 1505]|uniref:Uncharacterized protein n=1 Tax=Thermofilum adornatum 1505 TaxID=697581 RepID=A0A3G1A8X0_9CREN|nr:hypothetical protein TCARB_1782 [Thermofilum adornatum 1505]